MATIGNVNVKVLADTSRFTGNMRRAKQGLVGFKSAAATAASVVSRLGKVAAVAAAASLAFNTFAQGQQIKQIVDVSDKLGIEANQLVRLAFAAKVTGNEFNKLELGLQRLGRRISEAAELGTGEAVKAFDLLGISAKELNSIPLDQAFLKISDAVAGLTDSNLQLLVTQKLVDSEAVSLVNTFRLQSRGIQQLGREADLLGLTFDRRTEDVANRLDAARARLGGRFTGLSRSIFARTAPTVTAGLESINAGVVNEARRGQEEQTRHLESIDRKMDRIGIVAQ